MKVKGTTNTTSWADVPILLSPDQAAEFLGFFPQFFRMAAKSGELKHIRKGKKFLFRREDLKYFIESLVK